MITFYFHRQISQQNKKLLEVKNLNYDVPIKFTDRIKSDILYKTLRFDYKQNERFKHILKNVSFQVSTGQLVGIIGSSGCGKSTLMNVISNKIYQKTYTGQVFIEGQLVGPQIKQTIGYVMQEDILFPVETPFETVQFVQQLKMQSNSVDTINKIIQFVGLSHVKNNKIGSSGQQALNSNFVKNGLSGGEKRRVSLARELITGCKLLLCDEITTGLDIVTANQVIELLHQLTRLPYDYFDNQYSKNQNLSCVLTIHQPSSKAFALLDKIIVMNQGEIVYFDYTKNFIKNMNKLCLQVPNNYNPSDFLIELVVQSKTDYSIKQKLEYLMDQNNNLEYNFQEKQVIKQTQEIQSQVYQKEKSPQFSTLSMPANINYHKKQQRFKPRLTLEQKYNELRSKYRKNIFQFLFIELYEILNYKVKYQHNYFYQFIILIKRFLKFHLRDPTLFIRFALQYSILSLFVGSLYYKQKNTFVGITNSVGALFFLQMCGSFPPSTEAALRFWQNRNAYLREHSSGLYATSIYYFGSYLVDFPIYILAMILFVTISWYMIGFNDNFERYILAFIILVLLLYSVLTFGIAFVYLTKQFESALVLMMMLLVILIVVAGPQITNEALPDYYKWLPWVSQFNYAFRALMYIMLDGKQISCEGVQFCIVSTGEQALKYYGLDGWNLGSSIGIAVLYLVSWSLVFYFIGYFALRFKRFS